MELFLSTKQLLIENFDYLIFATVIIGFIGYGVYNIYSWIKMDEIGGGKSKAIVKDITYKRNSFRPFSFSGRIGRMQYFLTLMSLYAFWLIFLVVDKTLLPTEAHSYCSRFAIVLIYISIYILLAQGVKRCHDIGHAGQFLVVPFHVFVFMLKQGQTTDNQYGYLNGNITSKKIHDIAIVATSIAVVVFMHIFLIQLIKTPV